MSGSGEMPRLRGHIAMGLHAGSPSTTSSERSKNVIALVEMVSMFGWYSTPIVWILCAFDAKLGGFGGKLRRFGTLWGTLGAKSLSLTCYSLLIGRCTVLNVAPHHIDVTALAKGIVELRTWQPFDSCGNRIIPYQSLAGEGTSVSR